jgi:hypothetical protein
MTSQGFQFGQQPHSQSFQFNPPLNNIFTNSTPASLSSFVPQNANIFQTQPQNSTSTATSLFQPITSTNTQNDKGQILQCLNESKNIQLEILKEIKMLNEKNSISKQEKNIHIGVSCNGCGKTTITGIRYKCLFCNDFDFCEDCESQSKIQHDPNHSFIKIKDTNTFNNLMIQGIPASLSSFATPASPPNSIFNQT